MVRRLALFFVAALLISQQSFGQATCTLWTITSDFHTQSGYTSASKACTAAANAFCAANSSTDSACTLAPTNLDSPTDYSGRCAGSRFNTSAGTTITFGTNFGSLTGQTNQTCPPPAPCNDTVPGVGDSWTSTVFPGSSGYCHALSECRMDVTSSVTAGGSTLYTITHTSEQCGAGAPEEDDLAEGENCITSGSLEFCAAGPADADNQENCGYVNDQFTCLGAIEPTGCAVLGDTSRVCGSSAGAPPAPDSGTPGVLATPTQTLSVVNNNVTTTLNYFNPTTVAGSARPPTPSGDDPTDGMDDGSGTGSGSEGEEGEEGSVSGGLSCASPPVCEGDPLMCASIRQSWMNRCVESPTESELLAEFGPVENSDGSLLMPEQTLDVPESLDSAGWISDRCPSDLPINLGYLGVITIPISAWCDWLAIFGTMVLVSAYLAGARIVFGGL